MEEFTTPNIRGHFSGGSLAGLPNCKGIRSSEHLKPECIPPWGRAVNLQESGLLLLDLKLGVAQRPSAVNHW